MVSKIVDKKGAFTLRGFMIGMIVFTMIMGGFAVLARANAQTYGVGDPAILDKYNHSASLAGKVDTVEEQVRADEGTVVGFLTKSTRAALNTIAFSIGILKSVADTVTEDVGIPAWLLNGFIMIMTISLLMALVFAVIRWYA